MHTMKAIVFDQCGDPAEVLQLREVPAPRPGPGQVRVRMLASPINPSDLLYIRGHYGKPPPLPATPGFEGVGVVEESGGGWLARFVMGKRVAVINRATGNWREQVVVPARQAIPVPEDIPLEQAATFFVNPASAVVMTRNVLRIPRGAWLMQTAAGSALGRMIIRLGKEHGFRTMNVVRRRDQGEELLRLGADAVICSSDESVPERAMALTNGAGVPFAIDAVGGKSGSDAVLALGMHGRMLVYGTLSMDPLSIDPRVLMVNHRTVEGFWLSEWAGRQNVATMLMLIRRIRHLMRAGVLISEVGSTFGLDQINEAVRLAAAPGRQGKVLLKIAPNHSSPK
jgi:NADPH:quinone reductase-like Zn-dependent oxidoreductase